MALAQIVQQAFGEHGSERGQQNPHFLFQGVDSVHTSFACTPVLHTSCWNKKCGSEGCWKACMRMWKRAHDLDSGVSLCTQAGTGSAKMEGARGRVKTTEACAWKERPSPRRLQQVTVSGDWHRKNVWSTPARQHLQREDGGGARARA